MNCMRIVEYMRFVNQEQTTILILRNYVNFGKLHLCQNELYLYSVIASNLFKVVN